MFDRLIARTAGLAACGLMVTAAASAECPMDLDENGRVGGGDLTLMLASWGPCATECSSDLDSDGMVDGADLTKVLSAWGRSVHLDCDCNGISDEDEIADGTGDLDGDGIPDQCGATTPNEGALVFAQSLDHRDAGPYDKAMMEADWNDPAWSNGVDDQRVSIVETGEDGNRALAVLYPEGEYGTSQTGAQWKVPLGGSFE